MTDDATDALEFRMAGFQWFAIEGDSSEAWIATTTPREVRA